MHSLQGIDLIAGGRNKRVHRTAPKSENPYVKLLVKVRLRRGMLESQRSRPEPPLGSAREANRAGGSQASSRRWNGAVQRAWSVIGSMGHQQRGCLQPRLEAGAAAAAAAAGHVYVAGHSSTGHAGGKDFNYSATAAASISWKPAEARSAVEPLASGRQQRSRRIRMRHSLACSCSQRACCTQRGKQ